MSVEKLHPVADILYWVEIGAFFGSEGRDFDKNFNVAIFLVYHTIHYHQIVCSCWMKITPKHEGRVADSIYLWDATIHILSPTCQRTWAQPCEWLGLNLDTSANTMHIHIWWRQFSGIHLGHLARRLERCPTGNKRLWTMRAETQCSLYLIRSTLILDVERPRFPWWYGKGTVPCALGVVILSWHPRDPWVYLPLLRTRRTTVKMAQCDTPLFFYISL